MWFVNQTWSIAQSLNNENKGSLKGLPHKSNLVLFFFLEIEQAKKKKKLKLPQSKSVSITYLLQEQQDRELKRMGTFSVRSFFQWDYLLTAL